MIPNVLNDYIDSVYKQITTKIKHHKPSKRNLNHRLGSHKALQELLENQKIRVVQTDKNLGPALVDEDWYQTEALRHLNPAAGVYAILSDEDAFNKQESFYYALEKLADEFKIHDLQGFKFIFQEDSGPARARGKDEVKLTTFYHMPKIHKDDPIIRGRPIVPSTTSATRRLSIWLDQVLKPLVSSFENILPDSLSLIRSLQTLKVHQNAVLLTFDVASLYPSINTQRGVNHVCGLLREWDEMNEEMVTLVERAMHLVLRNNVFTFEGKIYIQLQGTAMGTSFAPPYANLFLYSLEKKLWKNHSPLFFRRLIDDGLAIFNNRSEAEAFIKDYNEIDEDINITSEISTSSINFLDITIKKAQPSTEDPLQLQHEIYQKPRNAYLYVPFQSMHPEATKKGMIKGELIRLMRNCSTLPAYLNARDLLFDRLHARGYPRSLLCKMFTEVSYKEREQRISEPGNRTKLQPFVLPMLYGHDSKAMKIIKILRSNWTIITQSADIKEDEAATAIFNDENLPMVSYTMPPNVQSIVNRHYKRNRKYQEQKAERGREAS